RRTTRPADEVALGHELLERLDDDPPRDPELASEGAARGKGGVRRQAALAYGAAQRAFELAMEWLAGGPVERDEQLDRGTGPRSCHRTGPYQQTGARPSSSHRTPRSDPNP